MTHPWVVLWRRLASMDKGSALATSRRYRASERRRLRQRARTGIGMIPVLAVFDVLGLGILVPASLATLAGLNGAIGLLAIVAYAALQGPARHHPALVVFFVTSAVLISIAAVGLLVPSLAVFAAGYLLLLPAVVALFVPWRSWTHLVWLVIYALITFPTVAAMPSLVRTERLGLAMAVVVAMFTSYLGTMLAARVELSAFTLRQALTARRADLGRVNRALAASLRHDPMTGARNRLRLTEDLMAVRGRLERTGEPCGLLALDLDYFKAVNDRDGHIAGDSVLRTVVSALSETIRPIDGIYRTGGEEFVVLLAATDGPGVGLAAERLRSTVEALAIANATNLPFGVVTVSIGATTLFPADLATDDDGWFARADAALYAAKASGRNRIVARPCDRVSQ